MCLHDQNLGKKKPGTSCETAQVNLNVLISFKHSLQFSLQLFTVVKNAPTEEETTTAWE